MGISAMNKVISKGTMQFRSHDGCITTLLGICRVSELRYNLISLRILHGEGFNFSSEGDLIEVLKNPM